MGESHAEEARFLQLPLEKLPLNSHSSLQTQLRVICNSMHDLTSPLTSPGENSYLRPQGSVFPMDVPEAQLGEPSVQVSSVPVLHLPATPSPARTRGDTLTCVSPGLQAGGPPCVSVGPVPGCCLARADPAGEG